jgi:CRISPR/Cas system-associated protein Cas7 (RAMP superfamily)
LIFWYDYYVNIFEDVDYDNDCDLEAEAVEELKETYDDEVEFECLREISI